MKEKLASFWGSIKRFVAAISVTRGNKKTVAIAACVSIALIAFITFQWNRFLNPTTDPWGWQIMAIAYVFAILSGLLIAFHVSIEERYKNKFYTTLFFLMPIFTMQMVECFNGNFVYNFYVQDFFMNYFAYLLMYLFVFMFAGRFRLTAVIVNVVLFGFGLANYFIDIFRGTPLVPMDIFAVGTGMNVAAGYDFKLSWQIILALLFMVAIMAFVKCQMVNVIPTVRRSKILIRAAALAYVLIIASMVYGTDVLADHGFKPDFWNQSRGYHRSGSWYNFCLNTRYIHVAEPENYDSDHVELVVEDVATKEGDILSNGTAINMLTGEENYVPTGLKPNVIAIMNETLSDPATLGNLETNQDYLPFIHSLSDNTIKGTVSVPVFGAGTSNSEYEFLTGNSISMLPAGSSVYESYISESQPSLVSTLAAQGYSKTAFHPYFADGWNRPSVYKNMGFDKYMSMSDLIDPKIVDEYKETNDEQAFIKAVEEKYPDEDILLRRFVSDSYDFKKVIETYEQRDTTKPFFMFNVTMQNHGGYDRSYDNFVEDVHITNMTQHYPKAECYLSSIKQSDKAFQELVTYFSNVSEPTILLMFGDHQASIEEEFYEELYGKSLDDLTPEELQSRYHTPFVIWANYDIPEATVEQISANYLSTLLLQVAGLQMTEYNEYLAALYQEVPVVDTIGYRGKDGVCYGWDEENTPYSNLMNGYSCITYNNLLDLDHRDWSLFTLNGLPIKMPLAENAPDSNSESPEAAETNTAE